MKKKRFFMTALAAVMLVGSVFSFGCGGGNDDIFTLDGKTYQKGETATVYKYVFRNFDEDVMPISGYLGPAYSYQMNGYSLPSLVTDEVYAKIADAGVNLIVEQNVDFAQNAEQAETIYALAAKYGISYLLKDTDAFNFSDSTSEVKTVESIKTAIERGMKYKSFAGIYLRDEPSKAIFEEVGNAITAFNTAKSELQTANPDKDYDKLSLYYNLFPSCLQMSGTGQSISWANDYVPSFADLGPDYIMFDMYPITGLEGDVTESWFYYIGTLNQIAKNSGKMWMGWAQAGGETPAFDSAARVVNEGELNWNVNTMLAFGAKGIGYYPLVCPPYWTFTLDEYANDEAHSLINKWGNKTAMWYYAQKIDKQILAIDHILMNSAHEGVILHGESPCSYNGSDKLNDYKALKSVSGSDALIGCFNYQGGIALLVVNNSITENKAEITLNFDNEYISTVIQRGIEAKVSVKNMTLKLEAGECAMVVL